MQFSVHLTSRLLLALAVSCIVSVEARAQNSSAKERLAQARATYYTPTAAGLKSFHCDIAIDWKDMLTRFGGKDVADDNPFLLYLRSARLSVTDDLRGKGVLEWSNTATPPSGTEAAAAQMRSGLNQMIGGFFESWNAYMNGSMVPYPDDTVTVSTAADGLTLHGDANNMAIDEKFDSTMLLTEAHVVSKDTDTTAYPKYVDTDQGRLISLIRSRYRTPPSAPPAEVTLSVEYVTVSSFQIPSMMNADVQNVGVIRMTFNACTVKSSNDSPPKP